MTPAELVVGRRYGLVYAAWPGWSGRGSYVGASDFNGQRWYRFKMNEREKFTTTNPGRDVRELEER